MVCDSSHRRKQDGAWSTRPFPQEDGQGAGIAPLQTVAAAFSGNAGAAVMTIFARIDY